MLTSENHINIAIVDDHELYLLGLIQVFTEHSSWSVVLNTRDPEALLRLCASQLPTIVLLDLGLPELSGLALTQTLKKRHPGLKVLIMAELLDEKMVYAALNAGVDGLCLKDVDADKLIQAVEVVINGALYLDTGIGQRLREAFPVSHESVSGSGANASVAVAPRYDLTTREIQVLSLLALNRSNKEIAHNLDITVHTVKVHVNNVFHKLAVTNRRQAAYKAIQYGLLPLEMVQSIQRAQYLAPLNESAVLLDEDEADFLPEPSLDHNEG